MKKIALVSICVLSSLYGHPEKPVTEKIVEEHAEKSPMMPPRLKEIIEEEGLFTPNEPYPNEIVKKNRFLNLMRFLSNQPKKLIDCRPEVMQ